MIAPNVALTCVHDGLVEWKFHHFIIKALRFVVRLANFHGSVSRHREFYASASFERVICHALKLAVNLCVSVKKLKLSLPSK